MIETILIFLIVLGVLIFVHELGHFLVARAFGIRVDEFALGFGPKIVSKKVTSAKHGVTVYALNAIPFGGYVKIFGEDPNEDSTHGPDSKRSFVHKPRYVQVLVLVAGVTFNFIFALLVMIGAFMGGLPVSTSDYAQYADRFHDTHIVVSYTAPDSPAMKAGISEGDTIVSISLATGIVPNKGTSQAIADVKSTIEHSEGKPITVYFIPSAFSSKFTDTNVGHERSVTVTPIKNPTNGAFIIGLGMDNVATLSLPFFTSILEATRYSVNTVVETAVGFKDLIVGLFHADKALLGQVSGPVGIASVVGKAAHAGFAYLLLLVTAISINLAVLNLLPFPALDGGRILFVIIEAIIRRPIKPSIANTINAVGFGLLMLLMVIVTYHDIIKAI